MRMVFQWQHKGTPLPPPPQHLSPQKTHNNKQTEKNIYLMITHSSFLLLFALVHKDLNYVEVTLNKFLLNF